MEQYYVHNIDPIIVNLPGPLALSWYGLMYVMAFITGYFILRHLRKTGFLPLKNDEQIGDLLTYVIFGVIIGGRLGHVLFYDPGFYLSHPAEIFMIWKGGLSSHGGFIACVIGIYIFSKKYNVPILTIFDSAVMAAAPGLGFGRFGNFINGEMVGKVTDLPWAVIFSKYDMMPRHPVQLYQTLSDGVILFLILWFFPKDKFAKGSTGTVFLMVYGTLRIITEYFREVDPAHLGYYFGLFTMGQILSVLMIIIGIVMFAILNTRKLPAKT